MSKSQISLWQEPLWSNALVFSARAGEDSLALSASNGLRRMAASVLVELALAGVSS